ncbi:MAG TPA: hypothetical protein PKN96_03555 [Flavobacterium sp.]|uniref:hypothetical protein n=1 Tax=Flavobacterium sp. TaxID=239 RepID=UPI002B63BFD9|nr:hypothetical protein [Flavobacterium sp.]HNP32348.1 hypothetical protein [Flavobacterium sp.]
MKTSIILLGLVALSFTTINATNTQAENQLAFVNQDSLNRTEVNAENNAEIFNPNSVIKSTYVKTVEDRIAENKLITESKEEVTQPLSIATTIEDRIAEDNQIIESTISKEVYPLDFEKINAKMQCVKVYNNNAIINVDLKL